MRLPGVFRCVLHERGSGAIAGIPAILAHKRRNCRHCGASLPRSEKRCPSCGQPLSLDR